MNDISCRLVRDQWLGAAAYAYDISRNQPFTDGSKRPPWVLARLFLTLNDIRIIAFAPQDAIQMVLSLADGALQESEVVDWFRGRLV